MLMSTPRRTAGFTLVELLIALVLTGIIGAAIFQFLIAQGRFGAYQVAQQEASQNARGALELVVSELRAVPPGSFRSVSDPVVLHFRMPLAWGVLCAPSNHTGPFVVAFPPGTLNGLPGGLGIDLPDEDGGRESGRVTVQTGACAGDVEVGADAEVVRLSTVGSPPGPKSVLKLFTPVFLYQEIQYQTGSSLGGTWIQRQVRGAGGWSGWEPLAGPIQRFTAEPLDQNGTPTSDPASVRRVRVTVIAQSRSKPNSGAPVVDSLTSVAALRNP
jgi:prepilin-type N-terminal cleavage/methylation domain-containing protein